MTRSARALLPAAAALLLAVAIAVASPAPPSPPKRPTEWCIAGVCLGGPEQELVGRYGPGRSHPEAPWLHCYQARGKSIYVTALVDDEDTARRITAVLLSGEAICPDSGSARVGPDRAGCRGIRLFDPVEKLGTVGAEKRDLRDKGYPWQDSPYEVSQYDYRCEPDQSCGVMASAFVRERTIVAVSIWEPDC